MKKKGILFPAVFFTLLVSAQTGLISGPMLGPVELRAAKIWLEVSKDTRTVAINFNRKGDSRSRTVTYKDQLGKEFNPVCLTLGALEPNTTYQYRVLLDNRQFSNGEFTTKELWEWRKPAPDFSFLTGSCNYVNQPIYDRPGKPYGGDSSIYETMAKEKAAFMLWLGDIWYTREVDYYSEWGLWYRASHDRAAPIIQPFLKAMPHIATWDDHDFGPNDIGGSYILKETSRKVFNSYFCNPSSGENGEGIYTMLTWGDVDIFITDDRWWRSAERMADSVNGQPNPEKRMLGPKQISWLKNSLLSSSATFKIIVVGSQVLNEASPYVKWKNYPVEYLEVSAFLKANKINGVLFLTGDRHHSEIIRENRPGTYPLFDVTVSPLTSGTHVFGAAEKNNPDRVMGIDQKQNYGRISVTGSRGSRKLTVEFLGVKGEKLGEWGITEKELKSP